MGCETTAEFSFDINCASKTNITKIIDLIVDALTAIEPEVVPKTDPFDPNDSPSPVSISRAKTVRNFLDLPNVGANLNQFQKLGEVESVKSVSDIFSPISGEVLAVNQLVIDSPEIVNEDPYDQGWLVLVKPSQPDEMDDLMVASDYESFLESLD